MKGVYGLYSGAREVQRAYHGLLAAGVPDSEIIIISTEPFEEYEFSHRDQATWMPKIAAAGGILGLLGATLLTRSTSLAWPLLTGNMPIVAWWPFLIIIFEMTMLGAILASVVTLLITGKLLRRRPALYDPAVSSGKILVGVENPKDGTVDSIERGLTAGEPSEIKRV